MMVINGNVAEYDGQYPGWIEHEPYDFNSNCEWKKRRWYSYFNGWTIPKYSGRTVYNAIHPTEDEACWDYAGRRIP